MTTNLRLFQSAIIGICFLIKALLFIYYLFSFFPVSVYHLLLFTFTLILIKMKRIPHCIIIILICLLTKSYGQTSDKCNCDALIDPQSKDEIIVYDKPKGKPIKALRNKSSDENYLVLTIDNDSLDYFHVSIAYALTENSNVKGWVKKSNLIGTYARNYPGNKLFLYSKPDVKSAIKNTIPEWLNQLYIIKNCYKKWVYVTIKYNGELKEGWLQPDLQCSNPYTTCN